MLAGLELNSTGPYNVDRLYAAGVQIRMRKHLGLTHQKSVSLYGRGLTIFGSSNWSLQSFNYQEEHNYFTNKVWFFQWFVNQFTRKWNSATEFGTVCAATAHGSHEPVTYSRQHS
jgi:phosphatidylserine/phosphatidylglycerophosphate/cardiolipin synthase-like enzyme